MSNQLYVEGKQNLLDKKFDLDTDTVNIVMTDHTGDTPVPGTDDAYDDISAGTVGTPGALDSKTIANGVFDAADETFTAVAANTPDSLTIYLHNATPALAYLLVYLDTGTNLTGGFTTNGGDVTVSFHVSGIFTL